MIIPNPPRYMASLIAMTSVLVWSCAKPPTPTCVNNDGCAVFANTQTLGICEEVRCMGGQCAVVPQLSGTPCDDGDPCTSGDFCAPSSQCLSGEQWVCAVDAGADTTDSDIHDPPKDSADTVETVEPLITMSEAIVVSDTTHPVHYPPVILPNDDGSATAYYAAMDSDFAVSSIRARSLDGTGMPQGASVEIFPAQNATLFPSSGTVGFHNFLTLYAQGSKELRLWQVQKLDTAEEKAVIADVRMNLTSTVPFFSSVMIAYLTGAGLDEGKVIHVSSEGSTNTIFASEAPSPVHIAEFENEVFGLVHAAPDDGASHMRIYNLSEGALPYLAIDEEGYSGGKNAGVVVVGAGDNARIYAGWSLCGESPSTVLFSTDTQLSGFKFETELHNSCLDDTQTLPLIPLTGARILTARFDDGALVLSTFDTLNKKQVSVQIDGFQNQVSDDLFMVSAPRWATTDGQVLWPGTMDSSDSTKVNDAVLWKIEASGD